MATATSLQRMSAATLSAKILSEEPSSSPSFAVIDVRDDGSTNMPSQQLDAMMPTLVRQLKDKQTVVFHCMLSQQRGPSAALRYMRERDGVLKGMGAEATDQTVYVLDRGFTGWQEVYNKDERLTEGYRKEFWDSS